MISVKNLKFTYLNSKKLSLKIDSLQVAKGECLVLCGKAVVVRQPLQDY